MSACVVYRVRLTWLICRIQEPSQELIEWYCSLESDIFDSFGVPVSACMCCASRYIDVRLVCQALRHELVEWYCSRGSFLFDSFETAVSGSMVIVIEVY